MNFAHIRTMIMYESRMQWRRGSWHVVSFGLAAAILFTLLYALDVRQPNQVFSKNQIVVNYLQSYTTNRETGQSMLVTLRTIDPTQILGERWLSLTDDEIRHTNTTVTAFFCLWFGLLMLMFATLLFMSEVVPLDRQYNMRPLLDSTPLTLTTYLAGKVIAVWVSVLKVALGVFLIVGLITWLIFGPLNIGVYVTAWVAAFIPGSLFASALGVLAASPAITRRQALLTATIMFPVCGLAYLKTLSDLWGLTLISEPLLHFAMMMSSRGFSNVELVNFALNTFVTGLGILAAAWTLAWGTQRWQTSR